MIPDPEYRKTHLALERERGKAKDKVCVVGEDHPAQHWAHIKGADRMDAYAYQPMCVKHHNAYDWNEERSADLANRMRGNTNRRGKTVSDETRERIRQSKIGRKASPETRAKMSAAQKARYTRDRNT